MEHDTRVRVTKAEPPNGDGWVLAWLPSIRQWAPGLASVVAMAPTRIPYWLPMPPPPAVKE